jgi:hypothetical protein
MSEGIKEGLHPRNRFRTRYDFPQLIAGSPALAAFVKANTHGDDSIDYADPQAVKALNQALLKHAYGCSTGTSRRVISARRFRDAATTCIIWRI